MRGNSLKVGKKCENFDAKCDKWYKSEEYFLESLVVKDKKCSSRWTVGNRACTDGLEDKEDRLRIQRNKVQVYQSSSKGC